MPGEVEAGSHAAGSDRPTKKARDTDNLRKMVQQFFTKGAHTILSSRVNLPISFSRDPNTHETKPRTSRWFNLISDESDDLTEQLSEWLSVDPHTSRPQPLVIEVYLDTAELTRNQTLVVIDERGRRWDVCEALASPPSSSTSSRTKRVKNARVVLERWTLSLEDSITSSGGLADDLLLPNVYKKAIVMFRSLYTYVRFMPAWKFGRRIAKQPATLTSIRPMYRIARQSTSSFGDQSLQMPLYPSKDAATEFYRIKPTQTPLGPMCIEVTYRKNCDFRVDDSEAMLSSQFNRMDDSYFKPSLGTSAGQGLPYLAGGKEVGSLPADRKGLMDLPEQTQAYGSMSTFHNVGPKPGTSPISALRAARELTLDSPPESPKQPAPTGQRPGTTPRASFKTADNPPPTQRRVSISFQPFKAGSLSSSPANGPLSPGLASPRIPTASGGPGTAQHLRQPSSLSGQVQQGFPKPSPPASVEVAVGSPGSQSPKAPSISRYSSSFGHRRSRFSSGGTTGKTEDDNSSGRASLASSNQPGSGLLATEGDETSSGSVHGDDDNNISDFIKMLEKEKNLKSFESHDDASQDQPSRRTTVALSKFQRLRDSHAALTDSLSSSAMLQRSTSSSNRQLSSVPPTLAGASVSTSSSPGKPISPHTPHTPAIPSRLSMGSNVYEVDSIRSGGRNATRRDQTVSPDQDNSSEGTARPGSTAIDIPTSPMRYPHIRRSSSAAQRNRVIEDEYGMRSASLPSEERPDLSLSELLSLQQPPLDPSSIQPQSSTMGSGGDISASEGSRGNTTDNERQSGLPESASSRRSYAAPRFMRGIGMARRRSSTERAGRYSFSSRHQPSTSIDDDEPLLFTMSELGTQHSRRGLEDNDHI